MKSAIALVALLLSSYSFAMEREWQPALSLNVSYSKPMSSSIKDAYTRNGVDKPQDGVVLFGARGIMVHKNRFKIGIDTKFGQESEDNDAETYGAFYYTGSFSVYTGYNVVSTEKFAFTTALLVGAGYENLDVFGTPQSGKWSEDFGFAEPELSFEYHIFPKISLGLTTSYAIKFARSTDILGDDLGVKSKDDTFKVGLSFIFTNFL
jgi:hypothetical protein